MPNPFCKLIFWRHKANDQISLGARIFTIADSLDAMISDRPYRRALPVSHAREEIRRCSGTQFDPQSWRSSLLSLNNTGLICANIWARRSGSRI